MGAAWCLGREGWCGGFAVGWNPSDGCAATSLSQGRQWAPAGDAFGGSGRVLEALARFVDGCCLGMEGWRGGFAAERNLFGGQRLLRKASGRWRRLPALLMGAAWCLGREGWRGGFTAGWNPSGGFAATSLSQGRLWVPAGGTFWGKRASAEALARFLMGAAWCFAMEGWRGGFAAERNFSSGRRFLWKAGGFLGACLLCRWMLLSAWGGTGGAAASLGGEIPPTAAPPPPFHKGGIELRWVMLLGESGWALEALARFVDGCCLVLGEGRAARRLRCRAESFRWTAFWEAGRR